MKNVYMGWHVLYVKCQHEKKINSLLEEQEFDTFLPLVSTIKQWSDRKKKVQIPLFSSYIFINTNSKYDFFKVLNIEGVFKYIRFGNEYAKVREEEIFKIKNLLDVEGVFNVKVVENGFKKGDKAIINCGSLSNLECEILKTNNGNKILVRLESIGQNIIASVPPHYLTATSDNIKSNRFVGKSD